MSDRSSATEARRGLPAGLGVLEIPVGADVHCMVEHLRHGAARDDTGTTSVVLLHDMDRDLDDHRSLAWFLFKAGFNVLNLDLPGHGMSSGGAADMPAAITAATTFALADGANGVAYVADGRLGAILMTLPPNHAAAVVLIHPEPGDEATPPVEGWENVPSLYVVDPNDTHSDGYVEQLASTSRAWNLRCFVHNDDGSTWAVQSASLTRSFLLEQTFYWRRLARRGENTE